MFSPLNYSVKVVKLLSYTDKQQSNTKEISMISPSTQPVEGLFMSGTVPGAGNTAKRAASDTMVLCQLTVN